MNANKLKGYIVSKGYNTTTFLEALNTRGIKMSKNSYYRNLNGSQEFNRIEINVIADLLNMTDNDIIDIFLLKE